MIEEYNMQNISRVINYADSVINFSVSLDENNNIFILYNDFDGNLVLKCFNNPSYKKIIKKFNIEQNLIREIFLISIKSEIHIFYIIFSNITNRYSLVHDRIYNDITSSETILDEVIPHNNDIYFINLYGKYIYFFYKETKKNTCIMKRYNTSTNSWDNYIEKVDEPDMLGYSFHISMRGLALVTFIKQFNNSKKIILRTKDLTIPDSIWSEPADISDEIDKLTDISISDDKNSLSVVWKELGFIMYNTLNFQNNEWSHKKVLAIDNENIFTAYYLNNNSDKIFSCNFLYASIDKLPYALTELKPAAVSLSQSHDKNMPDMQNDCINNLRSFIKEQNLKIDQYLKEKLVLEKQISMLNKQLSEYEKELLSYKNQVDIWKEKHSSDVSKFNTQIQNLYSEKNNISIQMSKQIRDLNSVIDEKDKLINKINFIIETYEIGSRS